MEKITVLEKGQKLEFSFEDLLKYHGVGYPGGVAHAFQVMQRAFPQLDDGKLLERREIELVTAFPGPGGRDAFEMVTRCVTDGRIHVDKDLPEAAGIMESPHGINKKIFLIELTWKKLHGILFLIKNYLKANLLKSRD